MCVKSGAEMTEFAQTKPPSGREGDHGSGGRSPRNFIYTASYHSIIKLNICVNF